MRVFEKDINECRVNFRSKGKYKINDIAQTLGGGGHAFASGAMLKSNLKDSINKVVSATKNSLKMKINN